MNNEKNNFRVFLGGLITGGIIGGLAGLLFAPKSGKKMRKVILKKADKIVNEAQQQMDNASEAVSKIISDAKTKAEDLINDGKKKIEDVAETTEKNYKSGKHIAEEKVSKMKNIF